MDTTTVLEIIKTIDNRIEAIDMDQEDFHYDEYDPANIKDAGRHQALTELRNHLQSFIENEVIKAEQ